MGVDKAMAYANLAGYSKAPIYIKNSDIMKINLVRQLFTLCALATWSCQHLYAQALDLAFDRFEQIYQQELGSSQACPKPSEHEFTVCSEALRNKGNAPYILHHNEPRAKVIVLFHGLSDSPFYFRSIAQSLYEQGYNVVVALLPGHGKKDADADMQDSNLAERWRQHVATIVEFSAGLGEKEYIGGFSTGGGLASEYILMHPNKVRGLLLFSGALRLDSTVETMANIWGMRWVAKTLDGDYQTDGPNPFKYPSVSSFAALQLVDVIASTRDLMADKVSLNLPIFAAHSAADTTTLIKGVRDLLAYNQGQSELFEIDAQYQVCHANVVINEAQLQAMQYDMNAAKDKEGCELPGANPQHDKMIADLHAFLQAN